MQLAAGRVFPGKNGVGTTFRAGKWVRAGGGRVVGHTLYSSSVGRVR